MLIAVERLASREDFDLVVVDCAPAGAALRLVTLPDVAHGAVRLALRLVRAVAATRGALGSARAQEARVTATVARDLEQAFYVRLRALRRLLTSDATSVRLVTTPERIPIEEARRARTELSLFGAQVSEYSCVYTSRVSNLGAYSPHQYFRSPLNLLHHEL